MMLNAYHGNRARDWIRTSTNLRMLRPEHSASTNFATRAKDTNVKIKICFKKCMF